MPWSGLGNWRREKGVSNDSRGVREGLLWEHFNPVEDEETIRCFGRTWQVERSRGVGAMRRGQQRAETESQRRKRRPEHSRVLSASGKPE